MVGRIELASLLGDTLIVAGWHGVDPAAPGVAVFPEAVRVDAEVFALDAPPPELTPPMNDPGAKAFLARVRGGFPQGPVVLGLGSVGLLVLPEHLHPAMVDLPTLVEGTLAEAGSAIRSDAAHFLSSAVPLEGGPDAAWISEQIRVANDLLTEHLPGAVVAASVPMGLCVDQLLLLDERTFYLRGWARIGPPPGASRPSRISLTARSPEGARIGLSDVVVRFPRADVEAFYEAPPGMREAARSGFLACVQLPAPSRLATGWVIEMRDDSGNGCEAMAPAAIDDPELARSVILGDLAMMETLPGADRPGRRLMPALAHPALSALQSRRCGPAAVSDAVVEVLQFGSAPQDPAASVVVPLYGRIDFLEHQIAAFAADPEMADTDLIYVLDSPELSGSARTLARQLLSLYGLAFRLVLLRRNLGFAGATNAGASLAVGEKLLLLNSDVLPEGPGWLSRLIAEYDAIPDAGAVGPKLLYEDESIQHAGMWFEKPIGTTSWANLHYFKGLHRSFGPANVARQVPALTGACLLVDRSLYVEVGGLAGAFVQGDYEDSDLCLRLRARGRSCWYIPAVELYHLEGQSYPDELRRTVAAYNSWLQTSLWDVELATVMAEVGGVTQMWSSPEPDRKPVASAIPAPRAVRSSPTKSRH